MNTEVKYKAQAARPFSVSEPRVYSSVKAQNPAASLECMIVSRAEMILGYLFSFSVSVFRMFLSQLMGTQWIVVHYIECLQIGTDYRQVTN